MKRPWLKKGFAVPPESSYLNFEDLFLSLERFQTVFLQEGPVAPSGCQRLFPLEMESNEDLQREMKTVLRVEVRPRDLPFFYLPQEPS